jgi:hypothetical protein
MNQRVDNPNRHDHRIGGGGTPRSVSLIHGVTVTFALVASAMTLDVGSVPFAPVWDLVVPAMAWVGTLAIWILSVLVGISRGGVRLAVIVPVLLLLVVALYLSRLPLIVRVAMSDTALNAYVASLQDDGAPGSPENRGGILWVGFVPVSGVALRDGRAHLVTGYVGTDERAGLVCSPPDQTSTAIYEHVYGCWYTWEPRR